MLPKTLKNFTVFVDSVGYAGRIEEGSPPKVAMAVEEFQAGGMAAPVEVEMGRLEKIECALTMAEINPAFYQLLGKSDVAVVLRGAQEGDDGTVEEVIYTLRGMVREIEPEAWKAGERGKLKIAVSARYLKVEIAGATHLECDAVNMKLVRGGTDLLAAHRAALGL